MNLGCYLGEVGHKLKKRTRQDIAKWSGGHSRAKSSYFLGVFVETELLSNGEIHREHIEFSSDYKKESNTEGSKLATMKRSSWVKDRLSILLWDELVQKRKKGRTKLVLGVDTDWETVTGLTEIGPFASSSLEGRQPLPAASTSAESMPWTVEQFAVALAFPSWP